MAANRQLKAERCAPARFPVDRNFRAARFARDTHRCADKRERFGRGRAALHFNLIAHLPISATRGYGIFSSWKIDNRLWRHTVAGNLSVFASNQKLRARRFRFDFECALAANKPKWRQLQRTFRAEISARLDRFVTGTHDAQIIFARLQVFERRRTLFRVISQNHESARRGLEFLTRKVSQGVARIHAGLAKTISLGNLDAKRDWGYAPEFVDLMWRILQHKEPDDFVGATGEAHSVREFVAEAFRLVGISDWEKHVTIDEKNLRPSEVYNLRGDASKAKRVLGWEPKTRFKDLVRIMVEAEIGTLEEARPAKGVPGR